MIARELLAGGVDLVAAIKRQVPFMAAMVRGRAAHEAALASGGLEESGGNDPAADAVGAYAAFLARQRDGIGGQPSPLVDLLWHTHMQHPTRYARDSVRLAGRLVDHNDDL